MNNIMLNIIIMTVALMLGCSKEISPIDYGKDQCAHCRMTIVDKKYGSEIITSKGKVYKFDAAECTINYILESNVEESDLEKILVTDLAHPENFIDARTAAFLITPKLRSPMGENISAFKDKETAIKYQNDFGGELYDWNGLKNLLKSR